MAYYKEKHIRLTVTDTLHSQSELLKLIQHKIKANAGLSFKEEETFPSLISSALLSMGQRGIHYTAKDKREVPLGSLHTMLLKMIGIKGEKVTLTYFNDSYEIPLSDLWIVLRDGCFTLFPLSLQEAIHISREMPKREEPSEYIFRKDQKL